MGYRSYITAEYVRSRLIYDKMNGSFVWRPKKVLDPHYDTIWNTRYADTSAGTVNAHGYLIITLDMNKIAAQRLAWIYCTGKWPLEHLDHIDGNKLNNRLDNLRLASTAQNSWNTGKKKRNTSGIKGVFWDKSRGKWLAAIGYKRKIINLGRYDDKEEAAKAYRDAAKRLHGEYMNLGQDK